MVLQKHNKLELCWYEQILYPINKNGFLKEALTRAYTKKTPKNCQKIRRKTSVMETYFLLKLVSRDWWFDLSEQKRTKQNLTRRVII